MNSERLLDEVPSTCFINTNERCTMKCWLFFADTPLQMYNSALIASDLINEGNSAALCVYNQFSNAEELVSIYKKTNVFDKIEIVEPLPIHEYRQQFLWQIGAYLGIKKLDTRTILNERYDYFALACPTPATFEVLQRLRVRNKELRVSFYEDGTGSYNGEVFKTAYSFDFPPLPDKNEPPRIHTVRKWINALRLKRFLYSPERLYLKNPSLADSDISLPIEPLPTDSAFIAELTAILDNEALSLDQESNIIILDSTRCAEQNQETKCLDRAIEIIVGLDEKPLLRSHPRSIKESAFSSSCTAFDGGFWELFCRRESEALDKALLVSIGSSAQLSPIIEGNSKPYLMFLYKIAFTKDDALFGAYEHTASIALDSYGEDISRIFIPETLEEAKEQIESYLMQ